MLSKKNRYSWLVSYCLGFYIISHNSLRIVSPCGVAIDMISALLIFLGINKTCYLLSDFYNWYKGNNVKSNSKAQQ